MTHPLGWISPDALAAPARQAHDAAVASLPPFQLANAVRAGWSLPERLVLSAAWEHPLLVRALGWKYPGAHQLSGSCVGAGGGNALMTCIALDVLQRGDAEKIVLPGWLRPYGRSRQILGMNDQGEGSTGGAFAKAVTEGVPDGRFAGMPQPTLGDGLEYGASVEYRWASALTHPAAVVAEGKLHPVATVSQSVRDPSQIVPAMADGVVWTYACGYYVGSATLKGNPAVAVGRFDRAGGHQTSLQGYWQHPTEGMLLLYSNQWPASVYPEDGSGKPRCSCWVPYSEIERTLALRDTEAYPFRGYEGYPDLPALLDWRV